MIKVLHDYSGRPSGRREIKVGIYHAEDERLLGIGQYLLDSGHAVEVDLSPQLSSLDAPKPDSADALNLSILGNRVSLESGQLAPTQFKDEPETGAIPYSVGIDIGAPSDTTTFSIVSASAEGIVIEETEVLDDFELSEINALRKRYTELSGKKVYNGWDEATLRDKISELEERES